MVYRRSILLVLLIISLASTCFANDDTHFSIGASNELVDVTKLYVIDGEGEYSNYKALKGYPGEDKFQVYFEGKPNSYHVLYADLRGIDLDEVIEWEYEGQPVQTPRKKLYEIFSNSTHLLSRYKDYNGKFSQDWFRANLGNVYEQWIEGMAYSQDAQKLISHYFEYISPTPRRQDIEIKFK